MYNDLCEQFVESLDGGEEIVDDSAFFEECFENENEGEIPIPVVQPLDFHNEE